MKSRSKIRVTLQHALHVMQKGFERIEATMATKQDVKDIEGRLTSRIDSVDSRLDKIEGKMFLNHENRIDRLEDSMRKVKTKLTLK